MKPKPARGRPAIMRLALLLSAAVGSAAFAQHPDPAELIRRSDEAGKINREKAQQYAYREYKVTQEIDKNGKQTDRQTETWDVIGLEGSTYRQLIQRNDQPLPPKEQKKEDERLAKEATLRQKENPEQRRKRLFSFSYSVGRLPAERLISLFDLEFKGEEAVDGRPAYLIAATPKLAARPENANEKENLNYRMRMWIDRQDQIASRSESEVITDNSRMQKGTIIEWICARNEAGVCLIKEFHFRYNLHLLKLANVRADLTQTYSDYKRFQVDSRLVEVPK